MTSCTFAKNPVFEQKGYTKHMKYGENTKKISHLSSLTCLLPCIWRSSGKQTKFWHKKVSGTRTGYNGVVGDTVFFPANHR